MVGSDPGEDDDCSLVLSLLRCLVAGSSSPGDALDLVAVLPAAGRAQRGVTDARGALGFEDRGKGGGAAPSGVRSASAIASSSL